MILIEPKVELLKEDNFYSHVANCARVCYASNNNSNINDEQFCKNVLIANNHLSMFRHATIYCKYDKDYWNNRFETDWESAHGPEQSLLHYTILIDKLPEWLKKKIQIYLNFNING